MSCKTKDAHWPIVKPQASGHPVPYEVCLIFQPTVLTSQREILPHLPSQHHLCVLQGLVVQQPVQLCPLRWGMAVLVLHSDAVDGKSGAICEPGFHPVGVHIVAAGKQFIHGEPHFYIKWCLFGCPKPCHRTDVLCKIVVGTKLEDYAR